MHTLFTIFSLLAQTGAVGPSAGLTDAELLARHPGLAVAFAISAALGLVADVYLCTSWAARRRNQQPVLAIGPKPWTVEELVMVVAFLGGMFILLGLASLLVRHLNLAVALSLEVATRLVLLTALAFFLAHRGINWRDAFGFRGRPRGRAFVTGVIFYLAVLPPLLIVFVTYSVICRWLGINPEPQPVADLLLKTNSSLVLGLLIGFAVVIAPVFEEVFFRGFAYPALKQRWGVRRALLLVSALFALIHLHAPSIAPLFLLALGLGLAYEWTGSLITPITMHALFNTANIIMLLVARQHS